MPTKNFDMNKLLMLLYLLNLKSAKPKPTMVNMVNLFKELYDTTMVQLVYGRNPFLAVLEKAKGRKYE